MADAHDKCVVVGIAGLSFALLVAKLREGKLPAFASVLGAGELRPAASPIPARSPAAWASLSTGVGPGVHGFVLSDEEAAAGVRPAGYASWRAAPFWERLDQVGVRTASVGWPGTIPGAAWGGAHVDARLGVASGLTRDDWPLPRDVAPGTLREDLRSSRVHPSEIPRALVAPLDPLGDGQTPDAEARLAVALARLATFQAAVEAVSHTGEWDLLAIYQDWLESAAAALSCSMETLPGAAWAVLDQSLALVIGEVSRSSLVIVASIAANEPGFVLMRGPGFRPGHHGSATSTLAVTPTIFRHFGFASAELVDGFPRSSPALRALPPCRPRAAPPEPDPSDVARIAAFGHAIAPPDPYWRVLRLLAEAELILAEDPARAAALAKDALVAAPRSLAALGILATAQVTRGERGALPDIARRIAEIEPGHLWADLVLGAYHALNNDERAARPLLQRVEREGDLDERLRTGAIWLMLDRRAEAARIFRAILADQPQHFAALLALLSTETVRGMEAEQLLHRVLAIDPTHSPALAALEELLRSLGRQSDAAALSAVVD